jgi:hypothetical protein
MAELPDEYDSILKQLDVEIVRLPNETRGPAHEGRAMWANRFYIFDILRHVVEKRDVSRIVVADSDCVVNGGFDDLFFDIGRFRAVAMVIPYAPGYRANGISRRDLETIYGELYGPPVPPVYYAGGEFFAADLDTCQAVPTEFDAVKPGFFAACVKAGGGEEAHALSLIYARLGIPAGLGNRYVKRCWTSLRHRNTTAGDIDGGLLFLHVPAEKLTGFRTMYEKLSQLKDLSDGAYQTLLERTFGFSGRSAGKYASDLWRLAGSTVVRRMKAVVGK